MLSRRLCVAPMMDWTDRHCRYFLRLCAPHALLYTEMVHARAVLHGDSARLLAFDPAENPVALQLGGSDPKQLAGAARAGAAFGYDEVNLNVGCPSDRVQAGRFGACLMREPDLVAECIAAMNTAVDVPVTVKTRIGVDDQDDYEFLAGFVATVSAAGCQVFVIHARKAWLKGLSPKQNREIPRLRYSIVDRLKQDFPELTIVVNGGLRDARSVQNQLAALDGVMIGREAYRNPYWLAKTDALLFPASAPLASRETLIRRYLPYVRARLAEGVPLAAMTRHLLGLFQGQPGARAWRRHLSEQAHRPGADAGLLEASLAFCAQD